jgi:hypothetical protein
MLPKQLRFLLPLLSLIGAEQVVAANVSPSMLNIERFSAERGDAQSQYFLGEHYELGDSGVERDLATALLWYRKAADQGHAAAQYKLGVFHDKAYAGLSGGTDAAMGWYEKAAANGSDAAKGKLADIRKAEEEAESAVLRQKEQAAAAAKEKQRRLERKREQERVKMLRANKPVMAALPLKPTKKKRKPVDYPPEQTIERLLSTKWSYSGKPAEYLPAEDTSCLKTGEQEVTCFSRGRERTVKNSHLSFSVKAVLNQFQRNGGFTVRYFYNVTDIDKAKGNGPAVDPYGLKVSDGWQEPGLTVSCLMKGWESVHCAGNSGSAVKFILQ